MTRITGFLFGGALLAMIPAAGGAQRREPSDRQLRPELRIDYLASPGAIQAGAGIAIRLSNYLRVAGVVGAGPALGGASGASWRADAVGRFHVDPFRERRWGLYAGAGASVRGLGSDLNEYVVALVGIEGPISRGWSPALELALGGGARVGLAVRRPGGRWR